MKKPLTLLSLLAIGCGGGGGASGGSGGAKTPMLATPQPSPSTYASKLLGGLDRAAIEKTRSDMNAIGTAIGGYVGETGGYPVAADLDSVGKLIAPQYIRFLPINDAWGARFVFAGDAQGFTLTAPGADGQMGTGDDIALTEHGFTKLPDGYRPSF